MILEGRPYDMCISRLPFTSALLYNNVFRDAKSSIFVKLQKSLHAQSNTIKCARKTIIILLTTKIGHTLPSVIHYWKSANTMTYQRPILLQLVGKNVVSQKQNITLKLKPAALQWEYSTIKLVQCCELDMQWLLTKSQWAIVRSCRWTVHWYILLSLAA